MLHIAVQLALHNLGQTHIFLQSVTVSRLHSSCHSLVSFDFSKQLLEHFALLDIFLDSQVVLIQRLHTFSVVHPSIFVEVSFEL